MSNIARKPHCLKREKSLAMPRHIIFVDTETRQKELPDGSVEQYLKLGWAFYYRKPYGRHIEKVEGHYFEKDIDFWSFVFKHTEKKRRLWIIARNINFDFTVLHGWKFLRQVGFKLKFFHNSGSTTVISVRGRYGSILFVDSMNWFRESLAKTGERIGLPKLSIDFATCTDAELSAYCFRDVEIEFRNFKHFVKFLEDNQISRLRYTIGSTAMSAFLFQHSRHKIYIHNCKEAIDIERQSYRGGRVECFFIGEKNGEYYYVFDVNSLYPAVMRVNSYPVKFEKIQRKTTPDTLCESLRDKAAIAKVLIETDEPAYAVKRDRTIFPVGCFWAVLTTPELKYALARGHVIKVKSAVIYEQAKIFTRYVDKFYRLRQKYKAQGRGDYDEVCKLLLNTLYGKFGQRAEVWTKIGDCPGEPDRIETCYVRGLNNPTAIRYLLGEIFECTGTEESFNSFPAIASHVTAYARMYLYELIKQAGFENVFYCDTDSLIVNKAGKCKLQNRIDSESLGSLKQEQETMSLIIRGLKDYSIGTKQVVKGIRKNAVEIQSGVYEQEQWPSLKGMLRSASTEEYKIKKVTKILVRKYTKGTVNREGIVSPLVLGEEHLLSPLLY